jgi:hypothetical protein
VVVRREGGALARIAHGLKELDGKVAKVGWFETATYPSGTPVAYVATIHEFGAPAAGIPPRPFMRPAVADHGAEWLALMAEGTKAVIAGGLSASDVLEMVALRAAGDVAKKIQAVTAPPLSILTLMARQKGGISGAKELGAMGKELRKGAPYLPGVSTKPLVFTGQMIQSITGKVENSV